jgi:hypothetical protein
MIEKRKCIVCGKEYQAYAKKHCSRHRKTTAYRPSNAITCSKTCARNYNRVMHYIDRRLRKKYGQEPIDTKD